MTVANTGVELLICTRCRTRAEVVDDTATRPGTMLYEQLSVAELDGVTVTAVECLSNCSDGCTIALRGPGRWTYVYGRCDPDAPLDDLCDGVRKYAASADGIVPWRERPQHFRKNSIARVPPLAPSVPNLGKL